MKKQDGAPVDLVFPGGQHAGTGVFHDIGKFAATNEEFFAAFNDGKPLYLPESEVPGATPGVRAQIGGGEGHVDVSLSPAFLNASKQKNPWDITPEDAAQGVIDYNMQVFMALYGRDGINDMLDQFGQGHDSHTAPKPDLREAESAALKAEADRLRLALDDALRLREEAEKKVFVREETLKAEREAYVKLRASLAAVLNKIAASGDDAVGATKPGKGGVPAQKLRALGLALQDLAARTREKL